VHGRGGRKSELQNTGLSYFGKLSRMVWLTKLRKTRVKASKLVPLLGKEGLGVVDAV
jgi:hypothetical protein